MEYNANIIPLLSEIGKGIDEVHSDITKMELSLAEQIDILEIDKKIKRAKELSNIANKTTSREEFYVSINKISFERVVKI